LLIKATMLPGLMELAQTHTPTHLVVCDRDRVLPHPRFSNHFVRYVPGLAVTQLNGVGHIPMFEAPERVADLITEWVDRHSPPLREANPAG
jgi:pimeloyl-ACP methyl ester carboxylesterase